MSLITGTAGADNITSPNGADSISAGAGNDTISWSGANGDWNTAANWSTKAVPSGVDTAVIAAGKSVTIGVVAGVNFVNLYSEALSSFITPTEFGFGGFTQTTPAASITWWLNLIVGLWTLVSPWVLGFQGTRAMTVCVIIGIAVAALAAIELWIMSQNPPRLTTSR